MNASGERYRKLPGHLRGVVHGASAWLGPDHLLSVRSIRIREDYKRFYLRDIQAIVVAQAPRFHLSTRCFGIAAAWLMAFAIAFPRSDDAVVVLWAVAGLLTAAWIYICAALSCRCRIHTAASRDELPSIYRIWTARRFLDRVAPHIAAVQGDVEAGWAEAAEARLAGPPGETAGIAGKYRDAPGARSRTLVSDVFLTSLFASALVTMLTLRAQDTRYLIQSLFQLIKVAAAIAVLVQSQRGLLRRAMRRIAVTSLVATGALYYAQAAYLSFSGGLRASRFHMDVTIGNYLHLYEIGAAISVILGVAGAIVSVRADG